MKFPKPKKRSLRFMSRFDALELHACVEHTQDGETFIEQEDEVLRPTMFSVYGHLISPGGVECLEDFKTHRAALAWMKHEAARCNFAHGYEDFWKHGGKEQKPTGLRQFGPFKEITRAQASALPHNRVLTIVSSDDNDEWVGCGGYHFVNVLLYFRTSSPVPVDLVVEDVWLDDAGQPVADHE